jgi:hypothetical protein
VARGGSRAPETTWTGAPQPLAAADGPISGVPLVRVFRGAPLNANVRLRETMQVQRDVYYRAQHVTGPKAVLVSIKFGVAPAAGPLVVRRVGMDRSDCAVKFDLENYTREVLAGVARANAELNGSLQVEQIEIVPEDYPGKGQVEHVSYQIASAVLRGAI